MFFGHKVGELDFAGDCAPGERREERQKTMDLILLTISVQPGNNYFFSFLCQTLFTSIQPHNNYFCNFSHKNPSISYLYQTSCAPRGLSRAACQVEMAQSQEEERP